MVFDNMVVVQAFVTVSDNLASHLSGKNFTLHFLQPV